MKKLLSLVLALVLILSLTAVLAANAADNTAKVSLYDIEGNLVTTKTYGVGETIEVTVYLDTSAIGTIGSLKAEQDYTASVLKLADKYNENSGSISDTAAMFPVTKSATVANGKNEGKISYNASTPEMDPDGFDFCSANAKLIVSHYTVIAAGTAEITNIFTTLAYADYYLTRLIDKGAIVDRDSFSMRYTLSEPEYVPTEPSTAAPTTPPTVKPTTAPTTPPTVKPTTPPTTPPTVKPTTAPTTPPTIKPTTAPTTPPTVKPTTAPTTPPTVKPTTAPTTPPTVKPTTAPPTVRPTTAPTTPPTVKPTTPPTTPPTTAPVTFILGDVNSDSKVDMLDPTYIRRYCAGINTGLSSDSIKHGDVDNSGDVVIMDATYIQQYLAELRTGYPIGTTVTR